MKKINVIAIIIFIVGLILVNSYIVYAGALYEFGHIYIEIENLEKEDRVDALMEVYSPNTITLKKLEEINELYNDDLLINSFATPYEGFWYKVSDLAILFKEISYNEEEKSAIYCLSYHYSWWLDDFKIIVKRGNSIIKSDIFNCDEYIVESGDFSDCTEVYRLKNIKTLKFDCDEGHSEKEITIERIVNKIIKFGNDTVKVIIMLIFIVFGNVIFLRKYKVKNKLTIVMFNIIILIILGLWTRVIYYAIM